MYFNAISHITSYLNVFDGVMVATASEGDDFVVGSFSDEVDEINHFVVQRFDELVAIFFGPAAQTLNVLLSSFVFRAVACIRVSYEQMQLVQATTHCSTS